MKAFLGDDFLLHSETAVWLYHQYAEPLCVIDYHCHLSPQQLAENLPFENLTRAWLYGDHYKWRAMRTHGVDERFITGDAGDYEKFEKWADTVPYTLRNPLYHWTHLELKRYFKISELLSPDTAGAIFSCASEMLQEDDFRPLSLLARMKVELVCTTDDPVDSLCWHQMLKGKTSTIILPAWRPDRLLACDDPAVFNEYIGRLEEASAMAIGNFDSLLQALENRHSYFHQMGCRVSDHGLERFYSAPYKASEVSDIFSKIRRGLVLRNDEKEILRSALLHQLALLDHSRNWVQQYHVGAMRNNNARMMRMLGPDTGFDSIGDKPAATEMSAFLSRLDETGQLAKTILYNLNPADNEVFATMLGNFQQSPAGKMQWGSAWWFLDQKDGMERQINALSNLGLLAHFIGMITDSRSLLSYPRHEYFRRILCNLIGKDVENGELPNEPELLGRLVSDICYSNARNYFQFDI